MDYLRKQLGDTQSFQHDMLKELRALKVETRKERESWQKERQQLMEKIQLLEKRLVIVKTQNEVFRAINDRQYDPDTKKPQPVDEEAIHDDAMDEEAEQSPHPAQNRIRGNLPYRLARGPETPYLAPVSRPLFDQAPDMHQNTARLVSEVAKVWVLLQPSLFPKRSSPPNVWVGQDQMKTMWNELVEQIHMLSVKCSSRSVGITSLSDRVRIEFAQLTSHWKDYLGTKEKLTYIVEAFIWRNVLVFFRVFCYAYGSHVCNQAARMNALLKETIPGTSGAYVRALTAAVIHEAHPIDVRLIRACGDKIWGSLQPFMVEADEEKKAIRQMVTNVVTRAVGLATVVHRSSYEVSMHDKPFGFLMYGFSCNSKWMDIEGTGCQGSGKKEIVGLMVTPCLAYNLMSANLGGPRLVGGEQKVIVKAKVLPEVSEISQ